MYCYVKNNAIVTYIQDNSPFGIADDGMVYQNAVPEGMDGVNYPANWLNNSAAEWAAGHGLFPLVITGDQTQDPFHLTEYADSVINGVPTRTYTRALKSQADCQSFLYGQVASIRWQKETGPFTYGGITLTLDETTTTRVGQAVQLFDKDPTLQTISWKVGPAAFVTLDKATMTALGIAIGIYTQQLFTANRAHCDAIGQLTAAQCVTYDPNTGWPSNGA